VFGKSLFSFIYLRQTREAKKEIHNPTIPRFISAVDVLNKVTEYGLIHCNMMSSSKLHFALWMMDERLYKGDGRQPLEG